MLLFFLFKDFIYLSFERGEGREDEREKNACERETSIRLPLARPQQGTWPTTQACALTRDRTSDLSSCGWLPNPLSHTSQSSHYYFSTDSIHHLQVLYLIRVGHHKSVFYSKCTGIFLSSALHSKQNYICIWNLSLFKWIPQVNI